MKVVTAATMRRVDAAAIEGRSIPSDELMENAGTGIATRILADHITDPEQTSVTVFCGKGNNGGDGYVIARALYQAGVDVLVLFIGPVDKLSRDARVNFDRAAGVGLAMHEITAPQDLPEVLDADIIVDAIFGTGFAGAPRGLTGEVIEYINLQDALIVAVDMPSGLSADTGQAEGAVVQADYSYPLALPKYGLFLSPGRELSGDVEVIPIGIPDDVLADFNLTNEILSVEEISELLPERPADGHKGDFGRLLLVAGSTGLTGAAALASEVSLRTGCGLTTLACPASTQPVLAGKLTEVMTYPLPDVAKKGALAVRGLGEIRELAKTTDALALGPGIGRHRETQDLIRRLIPTLDKPTVIDADGLFALSGHTDVLKECPQAIVLTPHPGEFARLTDAAIPDDIQARADLVREFATEHNVVLLLKGSPTLIAGPGANCYLNPTGNHGMATGGSGDVLTGIIGSLLAQAVSPLDAAVAGAYIHGMAGDFAAAELTPRALVAGDLIVYLPNVFELLED